MTGVTLEIASDEGLPIRGVIEKPEKPRAVVVVIHGFKGFKDWGFFPWLTEEMARRGFAACRFDMSRNGIGSGSDRFDRLDLFSDDTYSIQLADLRRVVAHLGSVPGLSQLPLFLLGHSRGGAIAILGAVDTPRLKGVATWSAIASVDRWDGETKRRWRSEGTLDIPNQRTGQVMPMSTAVLDDLEKNRSRLEMDRALDHLQVPLLVIHGASDESVPPSEARHIASRAPNSSLVVIDGGTHTFSAIHPLVHVPRPLRLVTDITTRFIGMHC